MVSLFERNSRFGMGPSHFVHSLSAVFNEFPLPRIERLSRLQRRVCLVVPEK